MALGEQKLVLWVWLFHGMEPCMPACHLPYWSGYALRGNSGIFLFLFRGKHPIVGFGSLICHYTAIMETVSTLCKMTHQICWKMKFEGKQLFHGFHLLFCSFSTSWMFFFCYNDNCLFHPQTHLFILPLETSVTDSILHSAFINFSSPFFFHTLMCLKTWWF